MTTADDELRDAIARADRGMERTDNKGILLATLMTLAIAAAGALLAFPIPAAATLVGWLAVACNLATIVLMVITARPSLPKHTGDFGVMLWATSTAEQLADHAHQVAANPVPYRSRELAGLGTMLRAKYQRQRQAFNLFIASIILGAVTIAIVVADSLK